VVSVESKYSKLLEEKIADVDQFTKDRLHKTEELNSTLLKKAKEDSKLLEARELEIQIFEKRLLKNNQVFLSLCVSFAPTVGLFCPDSGSLLPRLWVSFAPTVRLFCSNSGSLLPR